MTLLVAVCSLSAFGADDAKEAGPNVHVQLQPRYVETIAGDPEATDAERFAGSGFRIRRALLLVDGTVGKVDWRLRFDGAKAFSFADASGKTKWAAKPFLDDAYVDFHLNDALDVQAGQFKVPFSAQELTADKNQAFPERSIANDGVVYGDVDTKGGFSRQRDVGAVVHGAFAGKKLDAQLGLFNGDGANVWPPADGLLFAARVQAAPLGELKLDDADLKQGKPRLAIGVSANQSRVPAYDDKGAHDATATDTRAGAELRFAASGFYVAAEGLYGSTDAGGSGGDGDAVHRDAASLLATYYLPSVHLLPGVRVARYDADTSTDGDEYLQVGAVVNGLIQDQDVKVQLAWDVVLDPDGVLYHQGTVGTQLYF